MDEKNEQMNDAELELNKRLVPIIVKEALQQAAEYAAANLGEPVTVDDVKYVLAVDPDGPAAQHVRSLIDMGNRVVLALKRSRLHDFTDSP